MVAAVLALGGCVAEIEGGTPSAVSEGALTAGSGCLDPAFGSSLRLRNDDSRSVPLPFPISFYGGTFTTLWVSSNGNATLNGPNPSPAATIVPQGARVLIAPLYGNFDPTLSGGDVLVNVVGTAPSRRLLVTWLGVQEAGGSAPSTFQLQLHESDGAIIFTYDTLGTDGINPNATAMNVGVSSGTGAYVLLASGGAIPALAGTATRFDWNGTDYDVIDGCAPPPANDPPVADAGPDQVLECTGGGEVLATLDGSASFDPNGDDLDYAWSEGGDLLATGEIADVSLALGLHEIDLAVDDGEFGDTDSVAILVQDTMAPTLDMTVLATTLWSPNHKMHTVLTVSASDVCCDVELDVQVTGGDPEDHEIVDNGDGSFDVRVRAERDGCDKDGRTYEITVDAVDCAGHVASDVLEVVVPHDQRDKH